MSLQPNQQQVNDRPPYQWFDTASGRYLQLQEQGLYDQAVVDLFGFNAVQMGCPQMDLLRNWPIPAAATGFAPFPQHWPTMPVPAR